MTKKMGPVPGLYGHQNNSTPTPIPPSTVRIPAHRPGAPVRQGGFQQPKVPKGQ